MFHTLNMDHQTYHAGFRSSLTGWAITADMKDYEAYACKGVMAKGLRPDQGDLKDYQQA